MIDVAPLDQSAEVFDEHMFSDTSSEMSFMHHLSLREDKNVEAFLSDESTAGP